MHFRICLVYGFLAVILAGCVGSEEKCEFFFKEGCSSYVKGDYLMAGQAFRNAIQVDPCFAPGYHYAGLCELNNNGWRAARRYFGKAAQLGHGEARLYLAELQLLEGGWEDARPHVDAILRMQPNNLRARLLEGVMLLQDDRPEEARKVFRLVAGNPGAHFTAVLAQMFLAEDIDMISFEMRDGADDLLPPSLLVLVGKSLREKKAAQAEEMFQGIVGQLSEKRDKALLLTRYHAVCGQVGRAEKLFDQLIREEPQKASYRIMLGKLYQDLDRRDAALDVFKTACAEMPGNVSLHMLLSEMYIGETQAGQLPLSSVRPRIRKETSLRGGFIGMLTMIVVFLMFMLMLFRKRHYHETVSVFSLPRDKREVSYTSSFSKALPRYYSSNRPRPQSDAMDQGYQ